jgi:hypothetical protein
MVRAWAWLSWKKQYNAWVGSFGSQIQRPVVWLCAFA